MGPDTCRQGRWVVPTDLGVETSPVPPETEVRSMEGSRLECTPPERPRRRILSGPLGGDESGTVEDDCGRVTVGVYAGPRGDRLHTRHRNDTTLEVGEPPVEDVLSGNTRRPTRVRRNLRKRTGSYGNRNRSSIPGPHRSSERRTLLAARGGVDGRYDGYPKWFECTGGASRDDLRIRRDFGTGGWVGR